MYIIHEIQGLDLHLWISFKFTSTWFFIYLYNSLSNSKMFVLAKNCRRKSKLIELISATVWNTSPIKIAHIHLGYDNKMADHIGNSTFVLKLVSKSFGIKNVTWNQPCSQLLILKFEKIRKAFSLEIWSLWIIGSSTNEEHSNSIV